MIPRISLRQALADPALLGGVLDGQSWKPWRTLLIAAMGEDLTQDERPVFTTIATSAATTAANRRKVRTDRSALRAKLFIRVSGDFRAGTLPNCGLRPRSLLHYRGKILKNLTTGELPKVAMRLGFAQGSDARLITPNLRRYPRRLGA